MFVVGDLNIVGSLGPLNTLLTGDIFDDDEDAYGPDSPPDWDGSGLADAHPLHNGVGPADYTWRNDFGSFDPGRLDYILYTDSVASLTKKFVLNTVQMTGEQLAATGLQVFDITKDQEGFHYDHLPVVADFRLPSAQLPGDYNYDGLVDVLDYDVWKAAFGTNNGDADGNGNNVVDAADFTIWRNHFAGSSGASVAEVPEPTSCLLLAMAVAWIASRQRELKFCPAWLKPTNTNSTTAPPSHSPRAS
jgi:hypothetical protein